MWLLHVLLTLYKEDLRGVCFTLCRLASQLGELMGLWDGRYVTHGTKLALSWQISASILQDSLIWTDFRNQFAQRHAGILKD